MPIDPTIETVVSLAQAARTYPFPSRRRGQRPNVATLYRWTQGGCRGVRLESVQIGGTRCTSIEALHRFFSRLTAEAEAKMQPIAPTQAEIRDKRRSVREAERVLDAAGIR